MSDFFTAVRTKNGKKQFFKVENVSSHDSVMKAVFEEIKEAKVVLVSVPCRKPELVKEAA